MTPVRRSRQATHRSRREGRCGHRQLHRSAPIAAYDPTDPRQLTPQLRLDALTAILAVGAARVLALCAQAAAAPAGGAEDSSRNQVDVPGEMRLHVPRG
jgi:hypothetical protein